MSSCRGCGSRRPPTLNKRSTFAVLQKSAFDDLGGREVAARLRDLLRVDAEDPEHAHTDSVRQQDPCRQRRQYSTDQKQHDSHRVSLQRNVFILSALYIGGEQNNMNAVA